MNNKPVFPNDPKTCTHKGEQNCVWLCNDQTIELAYPTYFNFHPRTPVGMELNLCSGCGLTRTYDLYRPALFGVKAVA